MPLRILSIPQVNRDHNWRSEKIILYLCVQAIQKWRTLIFWAYVVIGESMEIHTGKSMKAPVASEMAHWNQWLKLRFLIHEVDSEVTWIITVDYCQIEWQWLLMVFLNP